MKWNLLADVHLGLPHTQFPGQDYSYAPELFEHAATLLGDEQADETIVVGDLVNLGMVDEWQIASQLLKPLTKGLRVVPGNHDLVKTSLADFASKCPGAAANTIDLSCDLVRVFLNSAISQLTPWQWHGTLDGDALSTLERGIAVSNGRPLLVFLHHPPAGTVRTMNEPMMTLTNGHELMDRLSRIAQRSVIICGHNHLNDVSRHRNVTVVGLSSLLHWPHAYTVARWKGGVLNLTEKRVITSARDSPHGKSREDAVYRANQEPVWETLSLRLIA